MSPRGESRSISEQCEAIHLLCLAAAEAGQRFSGRCDAFVDQCQARHLAAQATLSRLRTEEWAGMDLLLPVASLDYLEASRLVFVGIGSLQSVTRLALPQLQLAVEVCHAAVGSGVTEPNPEDLERLVEAVLVTAGLLATLSPSPVIRAIGDMTTVTSVIGSLESIRGTATEQMDEAAKDRHMVALLSLARRLLEEIIKIFGAVDAELASFDRHPAISRLDGWTARWSSLLARRAPPEVDAEP